MQTPPGYAQTADTLSDRIFALIPAHPEIVKMDNAFDLFGIPGFKCDDLGPSLAQASYALKAAQQRHEKNKH